MKKVFFLWALLIFSFSFLLLGISRSAEAAVGCLAESLRETRVGQQGDHVKSLQSCLISLGHGIPAGATGYYGPQTRKAVKEYYQNSLQLILSGDFIGPQGIGRLKQYSGSAIFSSSDSLVKVSSKEELRHYFSKALEEKSIIGGGMVRAALPRVLEALPSAPAAGVSDSASRVSDTNVQIPGIDEPDIVKTDGKNIYLSKSSYARWIDPMPRRISGGDAAPSILPPPRQDISTIQAFPPQDLALLGKIEATGQMLLLRDKKILVIFSDQEILGFDVSNPKSPSKKWSVKVELGTSILSSRLQNGKIYFVTRQFANYSDPCPIRPLSRAGVPVVIDCLEIYRPGRVIPADSTFTAFLLNPETGSLDKRVSFVGAAQDSVFYMSPSSLYLTYSRPESLVRIYADVIKTAARDLFPASVVESVSKLDALEISERSKQVELEVIMEKYLNSLSRDEKLRIENEVEKRFRDYLKLHKRSLEKTTIVKISLDSLSIASTGFVPGYPLNQFSLDEYEGNLRVAVTVGERFWWGGARETASDVYVLDSTLSVIGSAQGLGLTERIYSVRFMGTRAYLVTFRQIDPFYVLDLSIPRSPLVKGELKIPGFSSYLEEISPNRVLGVGQEGSQVKVSWFDVSDPSKPAEKDKYILKEYWTEVNSNHHAFLRDDKHKVFFLPGSQGGYIFSYANDKLELVKAVSGYAIKRGLYLDEYFYVIGENKITVFDERTWEQVKELVI